MSKIKLKIVYLWTIMLQFIGIQYSTYTPEMAKMRLDRANLLIFGT